MNPISVVNLYVVVYDLNLLFESDKPYDLGTN